MCVCVCAQSRVILCNPVDCSPPGSCPRDRGYLSQARILHWVSISYSRGSSQPRDRTHTSCVSCIGRWILYHHATWEAHRPPSQQHRGQPDMHPAHVSTSQVGEGRAAGHRPSSPTALSQHRAATHGDFLPQADGGQDALHALSTSNLPDQGLCSLVLQGPVSGLQLIPNSPVETTPPHGVSSWTAPLSSHYWGVGVGVGAACCHDAWSPAYGPETWPTFLTHQASGITLSAPRALCSQCGKKSETPLLWTEVMVLFNLSEVGAL